MIKNIFLSIIIAAIFSFVITFISSCQYKSLERRKNKERKNKNEAV